MTEWFPCCIKQFLLCQHLSWMLKMFSWCIHETYFATIIAYMDAFFETSSWLLIAEILLFSLVARRGCPCLTNQLPCKADGKTTLGSCCTVKCLVTVNCAERREVWGGAAQPWQQRLDLLHCCKKNRRSFALELIRAVGSSRREARGERVKIFPECNGSCQMDLCLSDALLTSHLAQRS